MFLQEGKQRKKKTRSQKRQGWYEHARKEEEKQSTTSREHQSTILKEKQSTAPEEKQSTTSEEKQSTTSKEKQCTTPEEKPNTTSREHQSTILKEKQSTAPEEKQSTTSGEHQSTILKEKQCTTPEERHSTTSEKKQRTTSEQGQWIPGDEFLLMDEMFPKPSEDRPKKTRAERRKIKLTWKRTEKMEAALLKTEQEKDPEVQIRIQREDPQQIKTIGGKKRRIWQPRDSPGTGYAKITIPKSYRRQVFHVKHLKIFKEGEPDMCC
uniref:Uncharacterized protein n=1 Tax=Amphimedon queenslandica TaxID=400682 RepID=A0A1X7U4X0_AMPQE